MVGLAEEAEVLLYPLAIKEGSSVIGLGPSGAGADSGEDDVARFGAWERENERHCQLPQP